MKFEYLTCTILLTFFAFITLRSDAANILALFPHTGKSSFFFSKRIMECLVEAGHHVTFVNPFPADNNGLENVTLIDSTIKRNKSEDYMSADFKSMSTMQLIRTVGKIYQQYCYDLVELKEIQTLLTSNEKIYDLVFVGMLPLYECFLPVAAKLGVPVIGTFSLRPFKYVDEAFGNPHPLVNPGNFLPYAKKMSLFERISNAFKSTYENLLMDLLWGTMVDDFYREIFPDYRLRPDQQPRMELLFSNNHASFFSTSSVPLVIEVAGIHMAVAKPLPEDIEKFIDDSAEGVILFTFGSVTTSDSMTVESRKLFRDCFADLSQRVIWKFEDRVHNLSSNVFVADWVPQRDILVHENVKAFITHGGASGMYEAIDAGVPLVILPTFADQMSNAAFLHELEVGIQLDVKTLTKKILLDAINAVVHDKGYSERMRKLSAEFKDRPMSPQQSVVYWTEYVLRHNGTRHLKSVLADVPIYQYLLLDIVVCVPILLVVFVYTFYLCRKHWYCFSPFRKTFYSPEYKKKQ